MKTDVTITDRFVFFWGGWPSQWFKSAFVIDDITYNCCEQFMMAEKARVFGDDQALPAILAAKNPRDQKAWGRKVGNFDASTWNAVCRGIVYRGNLAKFEQNESLRSLLVATEDRTIVEASPRDRVWGIGLAAKDPRASDPSQWHGTNWLGIALEQVRKTLADGTDARIDAELRRQLDERDALGMQT